MYGHQTHTHTHWWNQCDSARAERRACDAYNMYIHTLHVYICIYIHIYITHTDLSIYLTYMCMHIYMYSNTNMYTIIYT